MIMVNGLWRNVGRIRHQAEEGTKGLTSPLGHVIDREETCKECNSRLETTKTLNLNVYTQNGNIGQSGEINKYQGDDINSSSFLLRIRNQQPPLPLSSSIPYFATCSTYSALILGLSMLFLAALPFMGTMGRSTSRLWSKILWLLALVGLAMFVMDCSGSTIAERQTKEVTLISYTYTGGTLAGSIKVQNLAYSKVVKVVWAVGDTWSTNQQIPAAWSSGPDSTGFEVWNFSGTAAGATQFYIQYTVNGVSYYDPGNFQNYQITPVTSTATIASSSSTSIVSVSSSSVSTTTTTSAPVVSGTVTPSQPPPILLSNPGTEAFTPVSGCGNFNGLDNCVSGDVYTFPNSAESRRWQTPPKGDAVYVSSFQDYRDLVGYADIQYNAARNAAVVVVNVASRTGETLTYTFNGVSQSGNTYQVQQGVFTADGLDITVTSSSGKALTLDKLYFIWQANSVSPPSGATFNNGQKGAIVELFGWPYDDIAKECEFIGKAGYMGVKIWPPTEHVWGSHYYETDNQFRPWYLVYQPVSYRLHSRMGTRAQLRNMIQTCRSYGVRVYADAVINHMSGQGTDIQNHRTSACVEYSGHNATAGSPYFTSGNTYLQNPFTGLRPALEFPAVPFGPTDFHCERPLSSWTDGQTITKGWLVGLTDLNTEKAYTKDRIATYLVDLLSIGFSGFRVDAAKHIGPASMASILGIVRQKLGNTNMPSDFITWLEVIMGGEASLLACSGGEWSWYTNLDNQLVSAGFSPTDISKVKVWSSDYPKEHPICGSWIIPASRFVIQNDDHDQQNPGSSSRDMADKGSVLIKEKNISAHRQFEVQLFTRTDADWHIKNVLSSYMFTNAGGNGFPDGLSDCGLYTGTQPKSGCLGVPKDTAYVAGACGYGGSGGLAEGKYTRVHRDLAIINAMRGWVGLGSTTAAVLGIPGCS